MRGYKNKGYASSFTEQGEAVYLNNCDGWLIKRPIANTSYFDLIGPYPLFFCKDLLSINKDILDLYHKKIVSLVFVNDQVEPLSLKKTKEQFTLFKPFKVHYVANLDKPWELFVRRNMRRYANKAFKNFHISLVENNSLFLESLWNFYIENISKKKFTINNLLTKTNLMNQLKLPGVTLFKAESKNKVHGIACYIEVDSRVYGHIIGCSEQGYANYVTYGLYGAALSYYQKRMESIDFGGNAGLSNDSSCGLALFKSGWCNQKKMTYLCGKITNKELYSQLTANIKNSSYFPAYRDPKII